MFALQPRDSSYPPDRHHLQMPRPRRHATQGM